jgi:hypothetical protein
MTPTPARALAPGPAAVWLKPRPGPPENTSSSYRSTEEQMSVTDNPAPGLDHGPRAGRTGGPAHRRPAVLLGVGLLAAAVVAGGVLWAARSGDDPGPAKLPVTAPISLPATIDGLAAAPSGADFADQPVWRTAAARAAPGATVRGRSYGSARQRRQIRVVAGRTDLTGKLEFAWPADAGHEVTSAAGPARCSRNLRLVARGEAENRPTMMFCWRTSSALSAYGVVIDFDHDPTEARALTALDAAWGAALTGT